jgi:hypothetical protein
MNQNKIDQLKPSNLFFNLPLYSEIKITADEAYEAREHLNYHELKIGRVNHVQRSIKIDGYNPIIKEQTTYKVVSASDLDIGDKLIFGGGGLVKITLYCTRSDHEFHFFILSRAKDNEFFTNYMAGDEEMIREELKKEVYIMKIGQYPSLAEFHVSDYKKYRSLLPDEKLKELVKGCRLSASGVGIGSFVYLRRIFEYLIFDAFEAGRQDNADFQMEAFKNLRMVEKIDLVQDYLPPLLVEHRSVYGILSSGLHELSEDFCNEHFPILRTGIELILNQKLHTLQRSQKEEKFKKDVGQLVKAVKNS